MSVHTHDLTGIKTTDYRTAMNSYERIHLEEVLKHVNWNVYEASELLGVSRSTAYRLIARHQLERPCTRCTATPT
jgi:transcriptional regulator of acetoin/glycerol metabolism